MVKVWTPTRQNEITTIRGVVEWDGEQAYVFDDTGHILNDDLVSIGLKEILYGLQGRRVKIDIQVIQSAEN